MSVYVVIKLKKLLLFAVVVAGSCARQHLDKGTSPPKYSESAKDLG